MKRVHKSEYNGQRNNNTEINPEKNNKRKNIMLKILDIIGKSILILIIVFLLFFIMRAAFFKKFDIFGYRFYIIMSGSMEPEIPKGAVIYVRKISFSRIRPKDVITYRIPRISRMHSGME